MSGENEEEAGPMIPITKEEIGNLWAAAPDEIMAVVHEFLVREVEKAKSQEEKIGELWQAAPEETREAVQVALERGLTIRDLNRVLAAKGEEGAA
tara:strand:- start:21 stop:305 length:285 start_codon:yes stop_codon:yes gene_type:complete